LQTRDFDGLTALIKSHQGKVVVMDAWSTSCPPCLKEFPNLVALHKKYGPEKVACISLSLDYTGLEKLAEIQEPVLGFLRDQQATFDNVLASEADEMMTKKLKIGAVPAVFVYDQKGELAKTFQGAFTYEQVTAFVESLVK
jgi:thiol-disulfide isomerase/thioredoxin